MFDPKKYREIEPKKVPVIFMLDVSGSMSGEKIDRLYEAVVKMVNTLGSAGFKDRTFETAIFTFGSDVVCHTELTTAADLDASGIKKFSAGGMTLIGGCLDMVKSFIEDRDKISENNYVPEVALVTDGAPIDEWERSIHEFTMTVRTRRTRRHAVVIGKDADINVAEMFTGDLDNVFLAESADDIAECFQAITENVYSHMARARLPYPEIVYENRL